MNGKINENKGNYSLIISVKEDIDLKIGAKGKRSFKTGYYVYIGSALNSLTKRIERHLSEKKKKHWHIDYLLLDKNTKIKEVIFTYSNKKIECDIANEINKNSEGYIELFGCSDCNCISHLYYFKEYEKALEESKSSYKKIGYKPYTWFN